MIVSFLSEEFKGLQNNASLNIHKDNYSLVKRPVELDELSCTCEPFTEDIQPTFLVVKDNIGGYVYGCLAGIPTLNNNNQTEITGTDLKSMLSSDIVIKPTTYSSVNDYIRYIFDTWYNDVNKGFTCELVFNDNVGAISFEDLLPAQEEIVVDALEEIQSYLRRYNLYVEGKLDLVSKKVVFTIGRTMYRKFNVKLWEYGIKNYGKWIASVNECQGYYKTETGLEPSIKWILTSQNQITTSEELRDIYPVKKKIITSNESKLEADKEALSELLNYLFNEDIEIPAINGNIDFETRFEIYVSQGKGKYKDLPCGALYYDANGLNKIQIGYRYTTVDFI